MPEAEGVRPAWFGLSWLYSAASLLKRARAARGITPRSTRVEKIDTHLPGIVLFFWSRCAHCVGLASSRLSIGKQRDIISCEERIDAFPEPVHDALLADIFAEDAVKDKVAFSLGTLDENGGCVWDVDDTTLEALGDQLVARLARLERWTDADGCSEQMSFVRKYRL
jgi:hypothetical protein